MSDLPNWLAEYLEENLLHDEVEHHNGGTTKHWDTLFSRLANLSGTDINIRANEIKRLLQDSGVSKVAPNALRWQLDPLPLMLSPLDWQQIEAGLKQRIHLLAKVKADLYGQQQLVLNGDISANLLHRESRFVRECFNLPIQNDDLYLTAVDLYRDPSGAFKVLNDHCQTPKGIGLLLENRIVARRVMSEEFAECNVQRVASFFQVIQQSINNCTSNMVDPRVVIWSQGVDDPNYSEHAFLATYLGYTLVQSADLTVRKGKVWLKSLAGLRKVDVMIRWFPDRFIDSLEQTEYSIDGIAGLFQAIREGTVKIINPPGVGVLESPAVKNILARLAPRLLGEELILGQPKTYPASEYETLNIAEYELLSYLDNNFKLDGATQVALINQQLAQQPQNYYFREKPVLSTAPFWQDDQLIAKPVIFRCFVLSSASSVHVLPSALCLSQDGQLKNDGWIKDTWINSQELVEHKTPKLTRSMMDLALLEGVISSRTAENLFWLGRYLERSENIIRLLRIYIDRYTELAVYPDANNRKIMKRLLQAIQSEAIVYPYKNNDNEVDSALSFNNKKTAFDLFSSTDLAGSVLTNLYNVINTSLQVKDLLSLDTWRIVDDIEEQIEVIKKAEITSSVSDIQTTLDKVMGLIMAYNGSIADSMSNSNGWFMLEMGRRIERSVQLTATVQQLLTVELDEVEQLGLLEVVLMSQVSLITHKRRYRMYQSVSTGLELLLLDAEYPRSLLYQLEQLYKMSEKLPTKRKPGLIAAHEKALLQSKTSCYLAERENLVSATEGKRENLSEFLKLIRFNLDSFCDLLLLQYFSHTKMAKKLTWSNIEQESL